MLKKYIYAIAAGVCMLTSCTRDFLDVNDNPNVPTSTSPDLVFANALNTTATTTVSPNRLGSLWSGHWGQSNDYIPQVEATYLFSNGDFVYWGPWYNNLFDYQFVVNNAPAANLKYLVGPARVMQALVFQQLTDVYNNIPYKDALKGTSITYPSYQSGQEVYDSLIVSLDAAIAGIKANPFPAGNTAADIIFRGNTQRWLRLANTIKLRILLRQSGIAARQAYIGTELQKIIGEGSGFLEEGTDVIINPGYSNASGKLNPLYLSIGYNDAGTPVSGNSLIRMSNVLIEALKDNADTFRLKRIAYPIGGEDQNNPGNAQRPMIAANYTGVPLGARGPEYATPLSSGPGPAVIVRSTGAANGIVLMTAAECFFLQAEAALRFPGAGMGTAKSLYEKGVREAFRAIGVPGATAQADVLLSKSANFDAATTEVAKFRLIWYQKWVALANHNGLEAWSEYRRTNYPVVPRSQAASTANAPWRLLYPLSEITTNLENVQQQGTIDPFTSKIFWDVN